MSNLSGTNDPTPVDAAELVISRFGEAATFVEDAVSTLEDAINDLSNYDPGWFAPSPSGAIVDGGQFSGLYAFPAMPSPPNTNSSFARAPTRQAFGDVPVVLIPDAPDATIPVFTDAFAYTQTKYNITAIELFRVRLINFIYKGGTGIAAAVEQAIYNRDKSRQEVTDEKAYLEIQNHFESRGNTMPSGQHAAALNRATIDRKRMYEEISRSVMIKAAELEQENMRIAQDTLVKVDSLLVAVHNADEGRTLQAEETRINSTIAVYESLIRGVIARLEAHKITVDSIVAHINAQVEVIKANAVIYSSETDAYTAEINAEATRLTSITSAYAAHAGGVADAIRGIAALANVDVALYNVEGNIALGNAANVVKLSQQTLESKIKRIDVQLEGLKAIAAISAQVVASSLNSVTTSAGISQSTGSSFSHSYDETKDIDSGTTTSISETV